MQTKDLLKAIDEKELEEAAEESLFNKIVRGEDVTEQIKTKRGTFEVKYPRMADLERIGRLEAARRNEMAVGSFSYDNLDVITKVATLDILTVRGPAWYENAKAENKNGLTVWQNVPIKNLVDEVYTKTLDFCAEVQRVIETGGTEEPIEQWLKMSTLRLVMAQKSLDACRVPLEKQDNLWASIIFEIEMNYSLDGMRNAYQEMKKKEQEAVTADKLRSLGYTEDDIARSGVLK